VLRRERRVLAGLAAASATRSWASSLVTSFLPLYAVARGADVITSSRLLTSFLLAGAVGGLVGGWLADRFGRDRVIVASLLAAAPFCALLATQTAVGPALWVAATVSGVPLNCWFVVLAVRGQGSMPGNLGRAS